MTNMSPDPGVPQTPYKAYVATAATALGAFVAFWVGDTGTFTPKEMGEAALYALGFAGVGGFATYQTRNKVKR